MIKKFDTMKLKFMEFDKKDASLVCVSISSVITKL